MNSKKLLNKIVIFPFRFFVSIQIVTHFSQESRVPEAETLPPRRP